MHGTRELMMERKTDFVILSRPVAISFTCPFCKTDQEVSWNDIIAPEYWGDEWDDVECPNCGELVSLGDWEYD